MERNRLKQLLFNSSFAKGFSAKGKTPVQGRTNVGTVAVGATAASLMAYYAIQNQNNAGNQLAMADDVKTHFLFGWGSSQKGQVGVGRETLAIPTPSLLTDLEGMEIKSLAARADRSAAINSYGELYTWGSSKNGAMLSAEGKTYPDNLTAPTVFASEEHLFRQVDVARDHTAVVTQDGKVITMGSEDYGKLGHTPRDLTDEEKRAELQRYRKAGYAPGSVQQKAAIDVVKGDIENKNVVMVACGFQHTVCLTDEGDVYSWGRGKFGALGHGDAAEVAMPKHIEGLKNIVKIDCGTDYTMALDSNGKLYAFGDNTYGQLGYSAESSRVSQPKKIFVAASQGKVVDFSCGEEHSAYLDSRGNAHTWGYGQDGQLGHKDKQSLNAPKRLSFDGGKVSKVVCGGGHTGLITVTGDLYLMGRGRDGQLGRGSEVESIAVARSEPQLCEQFRTANVRIEDIALGSNHTLAVGVPKI